MSEPTLADGFHYLGIDLRGKKVLDIADFKGRYALGLAMGGSDVVVVDPELDPSMAYDKEKGRAFDCRGEKFLALHPEFRESFDMVTNLNMSHMDYMDDHLRMLPMVVTALKPDGEYVVAVETSNPDKEKQLHDLEGKFKEYFKDVEIVQAFMRAELGAFETFSLVKCKGPVKNIQRENIALHPLREKLKDIFGQGEARGI